MKTKKLTGLKRNIWKVLLASIFFSIFISHSSNAQIIFRDLGSGSTVAQYVNMFTSDIDLNNDGLRELMFYVSDPASGSADWIAVQALNEGYAEILGTQDDTNYFPTPLNLDDVIDENSGNWSNFSYKEVILKYEIDTTSIGPWENNNFFYMGIRFKIDINWHYAWIRTAVSVKNGSASGQMTSLAYNSVVDGAIAAGDEGTTNGIQNSRISDKVRTYSFEKSLYIDFDNIDNDCIKIRLINTLGKEVRNINVNNRHSKLNLNDLSDGVYILNIQFGNEIVSRKINVR